MQARDEARELGIGRCAFFPSFHFGAGPFIPTFEAEREQIATAGREAFDEMWDECLVAKEIFRAH